MHNLGLSASASSDFMALYKWFYLLTYLLRSSLTKSENDCITLRGKPTRITNSCLFVLLYVHIQCCRYWRWVTAVSDYWFGVWCWCYCSLTVTIFLLQIPLMIVAVTTTAAVKTIATLNRLTTLKLITLGTAMNDRCLEPRVMFKITRNQTAILVQVNIVVEFAAVYLNSLTENTQT